MTHYIYKTVYEHQLESETNEGWEFVAIVPDELFYDPPIACDGNGNVQASHPVSYQHSKYLLRKNSALQATIDLQKETLLKLKQKLGAEEFEKLVIG